MIGKVLPLALALGVTQSSPVLLSHPLAFNVHPHQFFHQEPQSYVVARNQIVVPFTTASQYHSQDELGQTSYGYAHPGQAKAEYRDAFGNVVGSYSYIDANGKHVQVRYVSDANGFRVVSNNLPVAPVADPADAPAQVQETPEVMEAKRQHFAAIAEAKARVEEANKRSKRSIETAVFPFHPFAYNNLPINVQPINALPYTYVHPITVPSVTATKYHSQDELGQASFGHAHAGQSHAAVRDAFGNVVGSYAYINPDGQEIRVSYTAGHGGFRVISNALPDGSNYEGLPAVVKDTDEVIAAREAHLKAFKEAKERIKHNN